MLAKLIIYGSDRPGALARLKESLAEFVIDGVRTNVPLLLWIARDEAFARGETTTSFLARRLDESIFAAGAPPEAATMLCSAALLVDGRAPWRIGEVGMPLRLQHGQNVIILLADSTGDANRWHISGARSGELYAQRQGEIVHAKFGDSTLAGAVTYDRRAFNVHLDGRTWSFEFAAPPSTETVAGSEGAIGAAHVTAPMPGRIVKVAVRDGERVEEHALLVVLEAMKMEHRIEAPSEARVKSVHVKEGQIVAAGTPLVELGS
jgi:3-methylcrotonyl-CoA carboxylase alpha subunit